MATCQPFFKSKILDSDDPYWPIRQIFIDVFQFKFVKVLIKLILLCNTIIIILETVILLEVFDAVFFIKYYMSYIGSIFMWLTLYSVLQMAKSVSSGLRDLRGWKFSSAEKFTGKDIFFEKIFVILHVLLAIFTGITYAIPDESDKNFVLVLVAIKKFFPTFELVFTILYRLSFLILIITTLAPFHMIIYYCGYTRANFITFLKYVENLNYGYDHPDLMNSVYDQKYQRKITRRLEFCVETHVRLYSINNRMLGDLRHYIFLYSVIGALLAIGIVVYGVSSPGNYLCLLCMSFSFVLMFVHIIWVGQVTEASTSQMFETLKQTVWYYWNDKNKKIFLMLLLNSEKAFKIQFTQNVSINYELGLSIVKSIYSTIMVLARLQNNYSGEGN
ncbi:hypothetical protein Zmor_008270 [Zophobas morio]|uniref:Odorant receptor n=1 Tax=Zophobas morio TaxID=2755281 RepID=A0AA38IZB7_9CUCU|nr:hypothetical protein Zmor_008270 [Zophobas morio]